MASIDVRILVTRRHEVALPSPSTAKDLTMAIRTIVEAMPEGRRPYDDAYMISARDDEVVLWWDEGGSYE